MISDSRIELAVRSAEDAFWEEVVKQFPEAKTGDLAPDISVQLTQIMGKAIRAWIDVNIGEE
jgi:hypothetical protein